MWTSLNGLWQARRARRAAVAAIAPLVAQSRRRLHDIPEAAWREPYMVGFLAMLITLMARRTVRGLDTHALALVQVEAWAEITGLRAEPIGEEILHLSAMNHKDFFQGCRDAAEVAGALGRGAQGGVEAAPGSWSLTSGTVAIFPDDTSGWNEPAAALDLWRDFFEAHVIADGTREIGLVDAAWPPP